MNKKIIFSSIFIFLVALSGFIYFNITSNYNAGQKECPFCNPDVINLQKFYEDNYVYGMCSYRQVKPWHCLIITKRHIKNFMEISDQELLAVGKLIKKVNLAVQKILGPTAYVILEKSGYGLQSVPHLHFHYIAQKETSSIFSGLSYLWDFFTYTFKTPMNRQKIIDCANSMKEAI